MSIDYSNLAKNPEQYVDISNLAKAPNHEAFNLSDTRSLEPGYRLADPEQALDAMADAAEQGVSDTPQDAPQP